MIKTITDLARTIYRKDYDEINNILNTLIHPGTIGDVYEGTTRKIIKNIIGQLPNIKVCEGFIKNYRTGHISPQTDAIIYFGDSEEDIISTNHKIVSIDNVIAMIEVKKHLGFDELYDFYDKQGKVYNLCDDKAPYDSALFNQLKQIVFGQIGFSSNDAKQKSKLHYYLYHILKTENGEPLRICIGYYGFKKEKTLRDNLLKVIKERNNNHLPHTGMNSLPSLVVTENNCLVKMVGFPWATQFSNPYQIIDSVHYDGLEILIRCLASKIESKTNVRFEYNLDDFSSIAMNPFLLASINELDNDSTQYYMYEEQKLSPGMTKPYEPIAINDFEYMLINHLCDLSFVQDPKISIHDPLIGGHDLNKELCNLLSNRIVAINNEFVELITVSCCAGIWNGCFYVGENSANQFVNWMVNKGREIRF